MPRPNFFLIGAAKAGTTSFARVLEGVPGVALSPIKEPCHFSPDINAQTAPDLRRQSRLKLDRYLASDRRPPVHMHHVTRREDYERLFDGTGHAALRGECSTSYLPSSVAARLIHAYAPDARILAILRDPAARILSHYLMDWRTGLERRPLLACLREESDLGRFADFGNCRMYLAQCDYAPMLARYRAHFPASRIRVLRFEALVADPERVLAECLDFLGLAHPPGPLRLPRENPAGQVARRPALDRALYVTGAKRHFERLAPICLPRGVRTWLKSLYFGDPGPIGCVPDEAWRHLPQVTRLARAYAGLRTEAPRPEAPGSRAG